MYGILYVVMDRAQEIHAQTLTYEGARERLDNLRELGFAGLAIFSCDGVNEPQQVSAWSDDLAR